MSLVHPEVIAGWHAFSEPLEGRFSHAYRDVRGLVTVGVGNLCDPIGLALALPWQNQDGTLATHDEVVADFERVKSMPAGMLAHRYACDDALQLTDDAIDALVMRQLHANARVLARFFPGFEGFPASAQQALLSLAWACGAGSVPPGVTSAEWPRLQDAVRRRAWLEAAEQCEISTEGNAGVRARNVADRELFLQAAAQEAP